MLRFSIIHPTPDGTFHFSSHHSQYTAKQRIKQLKAKYRKNPEKFEKWFDPNLLQVRDNDKCGWRIP